LYGFDEVMELDRKNTIVGKCRGKAATANNKQFGSMAGVARWIIC